jgi:hypothetical protein
MTNDKVRLDRPKRPKAYFFTVINETAKEVPRRPIPNISLKGEQSALHRRLSSIEAIQD